MNNKVNLYHFNNSKPLWVTPKKANALFILLLLVQSVIFANSTPILNNNKNESNINLVIKNPTFKIIIDAGHGGHDPGCKGKHSIEKDISLSLALKVGQFINNNNTNVEVIYTRKKDIFVPLHERIDIANKAEADLFVSIHCNSSSNKSAHGTETFVMGLHKTEENLSVAKRENQVVKLEDGYDHNYSEYNPDSPAGHIILSMFQNIYLDQSINIAQNIESNFSQNNHKSRGVKQAGFVVLRNATMPSILIEAGFLTNRDNEQLLLSNKGQVKTAKSIGEAILKYVEISNKDLISNTIDSKNHNKSKTVISASIKPTIKVTVPKAELNLDSKLHAKISTFRIQLAATTKKSINTKKGKWEEIKDLNIVNSENLYKYYTGSYNKKEEATKEKLRLRAMGFKGAFVVMHQGG